MHFEILSDTPMKHQSHFEASLPINIYQAVSGGFPTNVLIYLVAVDDHRLLC